MNTIRICTHVTGSTIEEFLEKLKIIQEKSDLIELRVDFIKDLSPSHVEILFKTVTKPAIFTCRKQAEGGRFTGSESERIAIIEKAISLGFPYVDIEYSTYQKTPIDHGRSKLILSYHNFEETPPYWQLTKLVFEMGQLKPDIIKVATMVQNKHDNQKLLRVLLSKKPEENQIIIGMGETGKITRVLGPVLGGYLTYASFYETGTAPGQLKPDQLQTIYNLLNTL